MDFVAHGESRAGLHVGNLAAKNKITCGAGVLTEEERCGG
jgi:hypothetical protein